MKPNCFQDVENITKGPKTILSNVAKEILCMREYTLVFEEFKDF